MLLVVTCFATQMFAQQQIKLETAKFKTGDNIEWKELLTDDSKWGSIKSSTMWELQGFPDYNGYAWYRFHFYLPTSIKEKSFWKDSLRIFLNKIDDNDETYINGTLIGKTNGWNKVREYHVATNSTFLKWDAENVLAVRVFDGGGGGGMYGGVAFINMMDIIDGISMKLNFSANNGNIELHNALPKKIMGELYASVINPENNKVTANINKEIELNANEKLSLPIINNINNRFIITATFKEQQTGKTLNISETTPYILTPLPSAFPRINGAKVLGVRPGSPILYKIAATGEKPLEYKVKNLPKELTIDTNSGIITGSLPKEGNYILQLIVKNKKGTTTNNLTIKVGNVLSLTPPMGWNSWNCWGLSVSAEKVKSSAQALIDKGLIDHGWTFMNIDDGWEKPQRDANGKIIPNEKFPNMKDLGDWLHGKGLKWGIYSSPGPLTCGGYLGSYQHEIADANSYANWGIDYLKYDWCSYESIAGKDTSLATYKKPYSIMQNALAKQNRDIIFSLCQYGMKNVWEWGALVNGNCWRTTGDIEDTWQSLSSIGFSQTKQYKYAQPGRWNDPDMLIVGMVGWGENLHPTRLTPDEQYTHISLWSLLSAPLLIGCDISKMDDFTLNLLSNDEVIAIDQDILGKQAHQVVKNTAYQIWMKELEDGNYAMGIFNLSEKYQNITVQWSDMGLKQLTAKKVRDVWRQKDVGTFKNNFSTKVAPHGVTLIKVLKLNK